jgi:hypothetical protein
MVGFRHVHRRPVQSAAVELHEAGVAHHLRERKAAFAKDGGFRLRRDQQCTAPNGRDQRVVTVGSKNRQRVLQARIVEHSEIDEQPRMQRFSSDRTEIQCETEPPKQEPSWHEVERNGSLWIW